MADNGGAATSSSGQLVDERSLGTYAGTSVAVIAIWQVIKAMSEESQWWAVVVGALGALGLAAPAGPQTTARAWWRRVVIVLFLFIANTAVLTAAALGSGEAGEAAGDAAEEVV